jgi:thioredoxin-related protein
MDKLNKRLNLAVNLAIIVVLVLIGIVFAKNLLTARSTTQHRDYRVPAGSKISLAGVDWASNEETLLLVLEKKCPYCAESAPFYQQLAREAGQKDRVRLMVVLPQDISEGKEYLNSLNVPINEIRQSSLEVLGVKGTPTLILVNKKGEVMQSWAGKLPPEQETEVLKRITDQGDSR